MLRRRRPSEEIEGRSPRRARIVEARA